MFTSYRSLILVCMLLVLALPAAAAERVASVPEIKPTMRARFDLAYVLDNRPIIVGKGEVVGPNRAHFVLHALSRMGAPEAALEIVLYDGRLYTREDASAQWYVESDLVLPVGDPTSVPEADISNVPITSIGSKTIAGTPTSQYQIWVGTDDGSTDHIALDFFIGQQINYLYQYQASLFLTDPDDIHQLKLEMVERFYNFDDPSIVVGPPANAIERPAMAGLVEIRNGGILSTLAAPLGTAELRDMVAQRLKH